MAKALNCKQDQEADEALKREEGEGAFERDLSRGERALAGALDPGVEIPVDDVVIGAAGPAHGDGADQEEKAVERIGPGLPRRDGRERRRPPARQEEQPPADGPLDAGEAQIGLQARGRPSFGPMALDGIGQGRRVGALHG